MAFLTPLATIPQIIGPGDQQPGGPNLNPRAGKAGGSSGVGDDGGSGGDDGFGGGSDLRIGIQFGERNGSDVTAILPADFRVESIKEIPLVITPPRDVTVIAINDFQTPISVTTVVSIPNQVQVSGGTAEFVANTASVQTITSSIPPPPGVDLAALVTVNPQLGTITYDNNAFAFLGVGESVTYGVQFNSEVDGQVVTEVLPITITGINDEPVFSSGPETVSVSEPGSGALAPAEVSAFSTSTSPSDQVRASGVLSFVDKDANDTHVVTVKAATGAKGALVVDSVTESSGGSPGAVAWTYIADKEDLQSLSAGQVEKQQFVITVADAAGELTTQVVTVSVLGVNDKPVVTLTPVVDTATPPGEDIYKSFYLGDTASIFDPDLLDEQPTTPRQRDAIAASAPKGAPGADELRHLIDIDPATGKVTYDTDDFPFLQSGQEVVYTLHFHTQSGRDETSEYVTLTIRGEGSSTDPVATLSAATMLAPATALAPIGETSATVGGPGTDLLGGAAGPQNLTGNGGDDIFHFASVSGPTVITDFHPASQPGTEHDLIVVDEALFDTVQAVLGSAIDTGDGDVRIATADHSLLLKGVTVSMLSANDFLLA